MTKKPDQPAIKYASAVRTIRLRYLEILSQK
jgi:hypothetical protein